MTNESSGSVVCLKWGFCGLQDLWGVEFQISLWSLGFWVPADLWDSWYGVSSNTAEVFFLGCGLEYGAQGRGYSWRLLCKLKRMLTVGSVLPWVAGSVLASHKGEVFC